MLIYLIHFFISKTLFSHVKLRFHRQLLVTKCTYINLYICHTQLYDLTLPGIMRDSVCVHFRRLSVVLGNLKARQGRGGQDAGWGSVNSCGTYNQSVSNSFDPKLKCKTSDKFIFIFSYIIEFISMTQILINNRHFNSK